MVTYLFIIQEIKETKRKEKKLKIKLRKIDKYKIKSK